MKSRSNGGETETGEEERQKKTEGRGGVAMASLGCGRTPPFFLCFFVKFFFFFSPDFFVILASS
jgi:hypothetical protein